MESDRIDIEKLVEQEDERIDNYLELNNNENNPSINYLTFLFTSSFGAGTSVGGLARLSGLAGERVLEGFCISMLPLLYCTIRQMTNIKIDSTNRAKLTDISVLGGYTLGVGAVYADKLMELFN